MPKLVRSFLLVAVAMGFLSCAQDVRPYDVRVKEALSEGLQEFNVKGASVDVVLPDGKIHRFVAGYSHDSAVIEPEMLFAIGSIQRTLLLHLFFSLPRREFSLWTTRFLAGYRHTRMWTEP
jgi:hypothetical protein